MATSPATVAPLIDRLSGLPLISHKMSGEYALYSGGVVVAFVRDDAHFIKPTPGAVLQDSSNGAMDGASCDTERATRAHLGMG